VKPENRKEDRKDRRLKANTVRQAPVRRHHARARGPLAPVRCPQEGDAVPFVRDHVGTLATIYADEGTGWDALHAGWDTRRVNHQRLCVHGRESRVQTPTKPRATSRVSAGRKLGTHHHISQVRIDPVYARRGPHWREDNRRVENGSSQAMTADSRRDGQHSG
jgi:hypothetical protein